MKSTTFQDILASPLLQKTIKKYIGEEKIDIVHRPCCFVVRKAAEKEKLCTRLIIFPPHGYTADAPHLMNPHPEAFKARMRILGKIDPTKKGYKPCIHEIKLNFSFDAKIPTQKSSAYAEYSGELAGSKLLSWKNWVYVVKKNRWGDFHNIINLSNEWVVVVIEKWLVDQKKISIDAYLKKLPSVEAKILKENLKKIQEVGDEIFEDKKLVEDVMSVESTILVPILMRMLNVQETGRHESCTFFGFLLKAAKKDKQLVLKATEQAMTKQIAPYYYLEDLQKKLQR